MGVIGEWQRGPVIGRGASATVSIATDRLTGDVFAVKSVEIARSGVLRREQSVLSALRSPYVVSCVGSGVSAAADGCGAVCYDLFLEFAPGGSLADEIKRCGGRCEEPLIRSRAGDVLRGLAHVHCAGIAHCDVKGWNVLVGADGRAKLADFGCARWTAEDSNAGGATIRGTPMFLAPEAARGEAQGTAADIWALGCTVIEMATGGPPWPTFADPVAALHHVAHSSDVPEAPAWFSDEGKDFLARCLMRDPAERWTAEQLLEHPFVASSQANSTSKATPIEQWVSPKSILDQGFWDDTSSTDLHDGGAHARRPCPRIGGRRVRRARLDLERRGLDHRVRVHRQRRRHTLPKIRSGHNGRRQQQWRRGGACLLLLVRRQRANRRGCAARSRLITWRPGWFSSRRRRGLEL